MRRALSIPPQHQPIATPSTPTSTSSKSAFRFFPLSLSLSLSRLPITARVGLPPTPTFGPCWRRDRTCTSSCTLKVHLFHTQPSFHLPSPRGFFFAFSFRAEPFHLERSSRRPPSAVTHLTPHSCGSFALTSLPPPPVFPVFPALRVAVSRVLLDDARVATGVVAHVSGRKFVVSARREVIVSASAIGSPKLLLLSGIGPKHVVDTPTETPHQTFPEATKRISTCQGQTK